MRMLVPALLLATIPQAAAAQETIPDSLVRARQLAEWFFDGQIDSLWANYHPDARAELAGIDQLHERHQVVGMRAGLETEVVEERFVRRNGQTQYWRTGWWSNFSDETITFRLVIVDGMVAGMGINPTSQNPPTDP